VFNSGGGDQKRPITTKKWVIDHGCNIFLVKSLSPVYGGGVITPSFWVISIDGDAYKFEAYAESKHTTQRGKYDMYYRVDEASFTPKLPDEKRLQYLQLVEDAFKVMGNSLCQPENIATVTVTFE